MNVSKPESRLAISTACIYEKIYATFVFHSSYPLFAQKTVSIPICAPGQNQGGWAGQTIGVTLAALTNSGTRAFIGDYQPLHWSGLFEKRWTIPACTMTYMDLTFVDIFEKYGLDAPVDSFANAYAHAGYMLGTRIKAEGLIFSTALSAILRAMAEQSTC
jgi:hypothetical protein